MSLKNIKLNGQAERGFTIVELLIVVVVIAILAAITIVSYNGITARANTSSAQSAASTYGKKAELYQGEVGKYPATAALLTSATADKSYAIASSTLTANYSTTAVTSAPTSNSTIRVLKCSGVASTASDTQAEITDSSTGDAAISGLRIYYWNFQTSAEVATNVGNTTNCPTS